MGERAPLFSVKSILIYGSVVQASSSESGDMGAETLCSPFTILRGTEPLTLAEVPLFVVEIRG